MLKSKCILQDMKCNKLIGLLTNYSHTSPAFCLQTDPRPLWRPPDFYFSLSARGFCSREQTIFTSSTVKFLLPSPYTASQPTGLPMKITDSKNWNCYSTTVRRKLIGNCLSLTKIILSPLLFFKKKDLFASWNAFNFSISFPTQSHNPPFVTSQLIAVEIIMMSQIENYNFRWEISSRSRWTLKQERSHCHANIPSGGKKIKKEDKCWRGNMKWAKLTLNRMFSQFSRRYSSLSRYQDISNAWGEKKKREQSTVHLQVCI